MVDRAEAPARRGLGWRGWALLALASILLWLVVGSFVATLTTMGSSSMQPTLMGGGESEDVVLVDRLLHRLRAPRRGEIVHFVSHDDEWVLKRVIGLPGETVEIRDGKILIDGAPLASPPEITRWEYRNDGHMGPGVAVRLKAGHYLVLGDDSQDSYDSRFWGALGEERIAGIARAIVWPPSRVSGLLPSS